MPGPPNTKGFKQNNVYTQKVIVKQANKVCRAAAALHIVGCSSGKTFVCFAQSCPLLVACMDALQFQSTGLPRKQLRIVYMQAQVSDQQELQKQRLLPSDSPRSPADSPRNSLQVPPQRLQQLSTAVTTPRAQLSHLPTQQQQLQQPQTQMQQAQTQIQTQQPQQQESTTWQWQPQQPNVYHPPSPQPPAAAPWLQNGTAEGSPQLQRQPSPRPRSAPAPQSSLNQTQANDVNQEAVSEQHQNGSLTSIPSRPRTATVTASPRVTNEDPLLGNSQGPKSVQWQVRQPSAAASPFAAV